jgi:micrococcal nuclease
MKKRMVKAIAVFFTGAILLSWAVARGEDYGTVTATVVSVYDGDTITVDIPGYPAIVGDNISVRVYGIDTPEMKGGTVETRGLAQAAKKTLIRLIGAGPVELREMGRDKYFRIDAEVWANGVNVGEYLINHGLAKKYDGGTKDAW